MNKRAEGQEASPVRPFFLREDVFKATLIAFAYFFAHQLAFLFPDSVKILMVIWPAGGIGLAALLLNSRRSWPGILAILFLSGLTADLLSNRGFFLSVGFMTANVLESLGCAWLISSACGEGVRFRRMREVLSLIVAAIFVNACTALIGAGVAFFTSSVSFWTFWKTWYISDGLGILLVTPLILSWSVSPRSLLASLRRDQIIELGTFIIVWCGLSWLLFRSGGEYYFPGLRPYMLMPLLFWSALRFGQRGLTGALCLLAGITISGAILNAGPFPFVASDVAGRLMTVQIFLGFSTITGLLFSAASIEKKVVEKAIRENTTHFSTLFRVTPVAVGLSRMSDNLFVDVNDAFVELFGYKREDIVGHTSKELGLWPYPEEREKMVSKLMEDGWVHQSEAKFRRKSGEIGDVLISLESVEINGEKHMLGVVSDITAHNRAKDALLRSEMRYRALFDHMVEGLAYCRLLFENGRPQDFIYLEVNNAFSTLTGLKNVTGRKVSEVIPGIRETNPELFERYTRVAEGGPPERFETYVKALDMWFFISVYSPEKDHFVAVFDVITERKKVEEALRQANEALAIAQRASGAGAWDWDMVNGETHWTPEFFHLMGLKNSSLPSIEVWSKVLHPDDRQGAMERLDACIRDHRPLSSEYRILLPSGEVRWIYALGDMEYNSQGEPRRMSGICIDVTMKKKAEEAILKLTEARSKFTTTVSHELRSPLATIKAVTDILLDGLAGSVNHEQRDLLGTAKESIDRLSRLVNNVLFYQKMEAGRMGYDIRENDLNEVLREACKNVGLSSGKRSQDIVMEVCSDLPPIRFDKDKIFQVLMNLMINAIKYSESGKILLRTQRKNNEICISVQDFGPGIQAGNLDVIFEPFSQIESNQKGGTGLGLAISKEIVLSHRGRIWVESEVGKGSTFYFTLPL